MEKMQNIRWKIREYMQKGEGIFGGFIDCMLFVTLL